MEAEPSSMRLFQDFPADPAREFCVVIPVRNEEQYITKCLAAFAAQTDNPGRQLNPATFEILLLANNCTDASVALINDFQRRYPQLRLFLEEVTLPPPQANIGFVRRELKAAAYERLQRGNGNLILTTDADTEVAADWLWQTRKEIQNGAEAVGGRILLNEAELSSLDEITRRIFLQDEQYQLLTADLEALILAPLHDPAPRHHQHFNGSFAITTDCFSKSGGVPDVAHLEDCAFFERLQRIDAKVRHSSAVKVYTSARCVGRTQFGLSYQLNSWKELGNSGAQLWVESGLSVWERFTLKKKLQHLWEQRAGKTDFLSGLRTLMPKSIISPEHTKAWQNIQYFGEFYFELMEYLSTSGNKEIDQVPVQQAIPELQELIRMEKNQHFSHTSSRYFSSR